MRISSLIKREPFYEILNETLNKIFIHEILKEWLGFEKKIQIRYVNEYLNFIAAKNTPNDAFINLFREYSFTDIKWRKIPQKVWAFLSTHKLFRVSFSQRILKLEYFIKDEIIIIGGNHRLRFYDFQKQQMLVFLKANDNPRLIDNEIELRSKFNFDYMPQIVQFGKEWFIEASVVGIPLNRLPLKSRNILKKEISEKHHKLLISKTMELISNLDYTNDIKKEIYNYQLEDSFISRSCIDYYCSFIDTSSESIYISQTHGDFQEGNVLVEAEYKPYVIDWECTKKRFYLYDDFVLWSTIRKNLFSEKLFEDYYKDLLLRCTKDIESKFIKTIKNKALVKSLLILEELSFQLYNHISRSDVFIDDDFKSRIKALFQAKKESL